MDVQDQGTRVVVRLTTTILALFFLLSCPAAAGGELCTSENNFALGGHPPKPTLGIRLFELNVRPEFPVRIMEELRLYLARELQKQLPESQYFGKVSILAEDEDPTTDFKLTGAFTHVSLGTNALSLYHLLTRGTFDKASSVSVIGAFVASGAIEPATMFQCEVACCTSAIGPPTGTSIGKARSSISAIVGTLRSTYSKMAKDQRGRKAR